MEKLQPTNRRTQNLFTQPINRRDVLFGAGRLTAAGAAALLLGCEADVTRREEGFNQEDLRRIANLAMDDDEAVLGLVFDRERVSQDLELDIDDKTTINTKGFVHYASTTIENKIRIPHKLIDSLPLDERFGIARVLLQHELWHYASPKNSDPEVSEIIFSKNSKPGLELKPNYSKGFSVTGTNSVDGKDYTLFNGVEEGSAYAAGNFVARTKSVLQPNSSFFSRMDYQGQTEAFNFFLRRSFTDPEIGLRAIAEIRQSPYPLRALATHIGINNLGLSGTEALVAGLGVLSYVDTGNLDGLRKITG